MSKINTYWLPLVYSSNKELVGFLSNALLVELTPPIDPKISSQQYIIYSKLHSVPRYNTLRSLNSRYAEWCYLYEGTAELYTCIPKAIYMIRI